MCSLLRKLRCRKVLTGYITDIRYLTAHHNRLFCQSTDQGAAANPQSKEERLYTLMTYYSQHPTGMWHELYHATIFLKDLFDRGCDDEAGREFARNWARIRSYICAKGGKGGQLSAVAKEAIVVECTCWCPSISKEEFGKICDETATLDDEQVSAMCDEVGKSYPIECRRAILLNSLCGASLQALNMNIPKSASIYRHGVTQTSLQAFEQIAQNMGVDSTVAKNIYGLYLDECRLKHKYDEFYNTS